MIQQCDFQIAGADQIDLLYAALCSAFPLSELRSYDALARALADPRYAAELLWLEPGASARSQAYFEADDRDWGKRQDGSRLVLLQCRWQLSCCEYWEYLAVNPALRGQGLGSAYIRQHVGRRAQRDEDARPLILEVEPPLHALERRRVALYERNGFHFMDGYYRQPDLRAGQGPVRLHLMSHGRALTDREFRSCAVAIAHEAYGRRDFDPLRVG